MNFQQALFDELQKLAAFDSPTLRVMKFGPTPITHPFHSRVSWVGSRPVRETLPTGDHERVLNVLEDLQRRKTRLGLLSRAGRRPIVNEPVNPLSTAKPIVTKPKLYRPKI